MARGTRPDLDQLFQSLDANGDRKISREEFIRAYVEAGPRWASFLQPPAAQTSFPPPPPPQASFSPPPPPPPPPIAQGYDSTFFGACAGQTFQVSQGSQAGGASGAGYGMLMRTDSEASSEQMPQDAGQDDESVSPMMGGSQQNWGDVFAALDRNADGVITREEFVDAFMRSGGAIVGNDFPPLIVPVQMYETMYVPREVSEEAFRASQAAAAAGSTFPFHDAAFGAHFRNKSQGDYFDNELLSVKPDARPPLEELLLTALREAQRQERVKHNKRLAERLKHKAMEAAHLGSFDDDYDEVKMPDVFAENAENDKQKSMAMTYVSPDPEYKGFIYWLS